MVDDMIDDISQVNDTDTEEKQRQKVMELNAEKFAEEAKRAEEDSDCYCYDCARSKEECYLRGRKGLIACDRKISEEEK